MNYTLIESIEILEARVNQNTPQGRVIKFATTLSRNYNLIARKSEQGMNPAEIRNASDAELKRLARTQFGAISREMAALKPLFSKEGIRQFRNDIEEILRLLPAIDGLKPTLVDDISEYSRTIQKAMGGRAAMKAVKNGYPPPRAQAMASVLNQTVALLKRAIKSVQSNTESVEVIEARVEETPRTRILDVLSTLKSNIALIQAKSGRLNTDIDLGEMNKLSLDKIKVIASRDYSGIRAEMSALEPIYKMETKKQLKKDFRQLAIDYGFAKRRIDAAALKLSKIIGARGNMRLVVSGHPAPNMFDKDIVRKLVQLIDEMFALVAYPRSARQR